jgi:NAD(P)-dependent dehydrogenase (short-subunit alcohol dehydrogenase family)
VDLDGQVAIVTGGAVRLGKAISLALAGAGAKIAVHYGKSAEAAQQTLDAVTSLGVEGILIQADLRDSRKAAGTILEATIGKFGQADILVNSAAIFEAGTLSSTSEDAWERHVSINLKSPFFLSQAFAGRLKPGQRAHIVNLADWRAARPGLGHLVYTLTKSALVTLTKSLALELAPEVQVNAIAPGAVLPPPDTDRDVLDRLTLQIPLHRTGSPEAITDTLLFLLRSDFVTGEVVHVTGGQEL